MIPGDIVDGLIQSVLQTGVQSAEPSSKVREVLLAAAADENALRSTLGPSIPPLADGLQESFEERPIEFNEATMTVVPLARKQLLLLASPLYAVR